MQIAKSTGIVPVPVGSAGGNFKAVPEVMFCDEQYALDGKIVGAESSFAVIESLPLGVRRFQNALEDERLIAAVAIAGPAAKLHANEPRAHDGIGGASDPGRAFRRKGNRNSFVLRMPTVLEAVEGDAIFINFRQTFARRPSEWHASVIEGENAFLEISDDS
ncbi:MAG: hypothetical protein JOZ83_03625 [Silvibacterium sp.]|nr:hypothetical protein [Silvibacterium sp.]